MPIARELVTKISFRVDSSSLGRTESVIKNLKRNLERLGTDLDSSLNKSIKNIQRNITKVSLSIRNLKRQINSINDATNRRGGTNGGLGNVRVNTMQVKTSNAKIDAGNVKLQSSNVKFSGTIQTPNAKINSASTKFSGTIQAANVKLNSANVRLSGNFNIPNAKINSAQTEVHGGVVNIHGFNPPNGNPTEALLNAIRNLRVMHADKVFIKGNISGNPPPPGDGDNGDNGDNGGGRGDNENLSRSQRIANRGAELASGGAALAATGGIMLAPIAKSIQTAADFEAIMSKVKALTTTGLEPEVANEIHAELTAEARRLGATTRFSATQAGEAMTYLGMAGWKKDQIVAGMTPLLDLAVAGDTDLATTADIVSDGMTAMHMVADEKGVKQFADAMAVASTNANTNIALMGETFKYAAAPAGALGYTIEDLGLATGLMANAGIKGSMAGTALRAIFTRMSTETDAAANAMNILGISMTDAEGKMKPFAEVIKDMRRAFKSGVDVSRLIEAQEALSGSKIKNKEKIQAMLAKMQANGGELSEKDRITFANMLAGQEHMSGLLSMVVGADEEFDMLYNAMQNTDGAAHQMAETVGSNLKGSFTSLMSAIEGLEISIGNIFIPVLDKLLQFLTPIVRAIEEFANEYPDLTAAIFGTVAAVGALLLVLGTLGMAIGGIMQLAPIFSSIGGFLGGAAGWSGIFTGIISSVKTLIGTLGSLFTLPFQFFSRILGTSGIFTTLIEAITLRFINPLRFIITNAFGGMAARLMSVFAPLVTALGGPIMVAIMAVGAAIYFVYTHWDALKKYFESSMPQIEAALEKLKFAWEKLKPVIEKLKPILKAIAHLIGSVIVAAVMALWEIAVAAFSAIAEVINTVVWALSGVFDLLSPLIDKFYELIGLTNEVNTKAVAAPSSVADFRKIDNSIQQNNTFNVNSTKEAATVAQKVLPTASPYA